MKRALRVFLVIISTSGLSHAAEQRPEYLKIRQCFEVMFKISDLTLHLKKAQECLAEAKVFETSDSLSGRSLYAEALTYASEPPQSFAEYQRLSNELVGTFNKLIAPVLTPENISHFSTVELKDAAEAINNSTFYSFLVSTDEPGVPQAELILSELMRRNAIDMKVVGGLFLLFLQHSEWQHAKNMSLNWPELGFIPTIVGTDLNPKELSYLTLSNDSLTLKLETAQFHSGPQIVMYGDCHFAFDLMKALSAQKDLNAIMKQFGFVISGAEDTEFSLIDSLRKEFPAFEMHPVYKQGLWAERGFEVMSSPSMVFLYDGVPKFRMTGSGADAVQRFCAGIKSIGLSSSESCGSAL